VRVLLTALITGFAATVVAGLIAVPVLRRLKAGQSIREDGPRWHMKKQGTPTMGGITFIFGIAVACFTVGMPNVQRGDYTALFPLAFAVVYAAIGFIDDFEKLRKKQNLGLTSAQKFVLQLAVAVAFVLLVRLTGNLTPNLYIPFVNLYIKLSEPVYLVFAAFVIVAEVNAVNLTDGLDGLAAGVTAPVAVCFAAISMLTETGSGAGIYSAALAGALIGFLLFNFHPAKVFMGDTGSLFLGGSVAALAFVLDMPLILVTLGIIFLLEALSDVIQVCYFKLTHGKRFFKMAPLHHHLELCGWSEYKLFFVFPAVSAAFAVISYFAVRNRYLI
jgi:phospho-N-acetylmuramoyl-pentapeptide-transferase